MEASCSASWLFVFSAFRAGCFLAGSVSSAGSRARGEDSSCSDMDERRATDASGRARGRCGTASLPEVRPRGVACSRGFIGALQENLRQDDWTTAAG